MGGAAGDEVVSARRSGDVEFLLLGPLAAVGSTVTSYLWSAASARAAVNPPGVSGDSVF